MGPRRCQVRSEQIFNGTISPDFGMTKAVRLRTFQWISEYHLDSDNTSFAFNGSSECQCHHSPPPFGNFQLSLEPNFYFPNRCFYLIDRYSELISVIPLTQFEEPSQRQLILLHVSLVATHRLCLLSYALGFTFDPALGPSEQELLKDDWLQYVKLPDISSPVPSNISLRNTPKRYSLSYYLL